MAKDNQDAKASKDAKPAGKRRRQPSRAEEQGGRGSRQPKAEKDARRSRAAPDAAGRACRSHYRETVVPELMKQFGYKTVMQVPRIEKITLNMGVGEAVADKKIMDNAVGDMTKIAGQKPVVTKARKSIANFKIRARLSRRLHGDAARHAHVRVPRPPGHHRASRASATSAASRRAPSTAAATTTWASRSRSSSPRSSTTRSTRCAGMNITITTTAKTDDEARALLAAFSFPFRN